MSMIVYTTVIDGEINVKNQQKFFSNLATAVNVISQSFDVEPLKSLHEKYSDVTKGLDEVERKDGAFYASYLFHKVFDDYFNNGRLKALLEEVKESNIEKKVKEVIKRSEEEANDEVDDNLPVVWSFKTPDIFSVFKKIDSVSGKEFETEYLGIKVYLTIRPYSDELGYYAPFLFFTKNKPRLGVKFGDISVDPYEIRVLQLNEERENFVLTFLEKILGNLTLKSKTRLEIREVSQFSNTEYLLIALRYTHWLLRRTKLTLEKAVNYFPFLLASVDKPVRFVQNIKDLYHRIEKDGVDLDTIRKEIENLGWYNITLPSKVNIQQVKGINKIDELLKIGMKLGNPIMMIVYVGMSIIYVYKVNGYDFDKVLKV
ncbi:hypothetical protein SULI_11980 [Saccharolobus solfataricus]|uniref:Uncharacterized protein n=3 Tax=Saccharolobus solfataricus TaxID=2287 RepID=Q97Y54_SACS2|nr:hypothetical protein [Saccharolobus solfataricus]AAK41717.1 Hypothetical protein SSO1491 [Saccharolobus solfataricus P2]AKA74523.1 hypothetical protein SULB_2367 [Saccharolobus solfataricus]AKA77219.1 hypothetical protein SULC_2364 [Saccharolobus solfataricus]AKA79911.1 hypothetical protein SULA_2366 [Saccharolobus solfataricus]AZF69001.1 hypothetical protein SULG_11980 [Saccharolobus solfataricus]